MTGNASKATISTIMSATPADETIAPDFARASSDICSGFYSQKALDILLCIGAVFFL